MLARALTRQRELAVRLSLGASRWRVARQLIVESLVLAVPASAVGLVLTIVTARIFPALVAGHVSGRHCTDRESAHAPGPRRARDGRFVRGGGVVQRPREPGAVVRAARADLARASRGEAAWDPRRSRLRTALVAVQIGACVLFLVGATGSRGRDQAPGEPGYRPELRARGGRVRKHPGFGPRWPGASNRIRPSNASTTAWEPPLSGPLRRLGVVASEYRHRTTRGVHGGVAAVLPGLRHPPDCRPQLHGDRSRRRRARGIGQRRHGAGPVAWLGSDWAHTRREAGRAPHGPSGGHATRACGSSASPRMSAPARSSTGWTSPVCISRRDSERPER